MAPVSALEAAQPVADIEVPVTGPDLVGRVVVLSGLKARPELNGRRGRAVGFKETSGRVAVIVQKASTFGGVEKETLALLPANLTAVATAAAPQVAEEAETVEVETAAEQAAGNSWTAILRHAGLSHLLHTVKWEQAEDELYK